MEDHEILTMLANLDKKTDELSSAVTEIKTALTFDGTGLIPSFKQHCEKNNKLEDDFLKFRRQVLIVFGVLVGSGVLGVSIWEVFK